MSDSILAPEQSHRMAVLFDLQDQRPLSVDERTELKELVTAYGHCLHEQSLRALAEERNLPLEQVRADVAADLDRALLWWEEIQADPARLRALVEEARQRAQVAG